MDQTRSSFYVNPIYGSGSSTQSVAQRHSPTPGLYFADLCRVLMHVAEPEQEQHEEQSQEDEQLTDKAKAPSTQPAHDVDRLDLKELDGDEEEETHI